MIPIFPKMMVGGPKKWGTSKKAPPPAQKPGAGGSKWNLKKTGPNRKSKAKKSKWGGSPPKTKRAPSGGSNKPTKKWNAPPARQSTWGGNKGGGAGGPSGAASKWKVGGGAKKAAAKRGGPSGGGGGGGGKIRIKCHYKDTRMLQVEKGGTLDELLGRVSAKFSIDSSFQLKYKDEDGDLVTIHGNEDLRMATSSASKIEVWVVDA